MNGDDSKKLITRHTGISIGVAVLVIGAVWFMAVSNTSIEAAVERNTEEVANLDDDFIPRGELNVRFMNIESSLKRIEKAHE